MTGKSRKQQIEEMLTEDPNDPFLRYGLAMEHVSEGQDEEAIRCFEGLLHVAPEYVPAYMQAGDSCASEPRGQGAGDVPGRNRHGAAEGRPARGRGDGGVS